MFHSPAAPAPPHLSIHSFIYSSSPCAVRHRRDMDYSSSPPAAPRKSSSAESMELVPRKDARVVDIAAESDVEGAGGGARARVRVRARAAWVAAGACLLLLLLGLCGAALLVWWVLAFHQSNRQLWMVPVSLVLLGTPVVTCLSIFMSGACRWFDQTRSVTAKPDVEPEG